MCECCGGDCKLCEVMDIVPSPQTDSDKKRYQNALDYFISCSGVSEDLLGEKMKENDITKAMISRIEHIGRAHQALFRVLQDDIFDRLSKHDPYWDSEDDNTADKLYDIRMKLNCLNDNLWDIMRILTLETDE